MLSNEIEPEGSLILDVSVGCSGNEVGAHQVWAERGVIPRGGLSSVPKIVYESVGVEPLHTHLGYLNSPFIMFVDPGHVLSRKTTQTHARYFVSTGLALMIHRTSF